MTDFGEILRMDGESRLDFGRSWSRFGI